MDYPGDNGIMLYQNSKNNMMFTGGVSSDYLRTQGKSMDSMGAQFVLGDNSALNDTTAGKIPGKIARNNK